MTLSLDKWVGKVAVVTGASSGIGATIAERLANEGLIVVGLARRKEAIEEISKKLTGKKGKLYAVKADLTKEKDILEAFKWIKENVGPVSILINNAAVVFYETVATGNTATWEQIFNVNILGLCIATREGIKIMRQNNIDGHIIHIGSVSGYKAVLQLSVYPGSKFAVRALAETLRLELNTLKSKIKISCVTPGAVNTPLASDEFLNDEYIKQIRTTALETEDIADAVVYVLSTPPHVQIQELIIKPVGEPI